MLRHVVILALHVLLAAAVTGGAAALEVAVTDDGLRLDGGGIRCSVDGRAQIRVSRGELTYVFGDFNARSDPGRLTHIAELLSTEITVDEETRKAARAQFALADGAHLFLELEMRADIPCVFVMSHLGNLGDGELDRDRWSWYHWAWPHHADEFISNDEGVLTTRQMSEGGHISFNDWAFIARRDGTGGLGLMTRHRISSDHTRAFIWATNRVLHMAVMPAADAAEVAATFRQIGSLAALPEIPTIDWAPRAQDYYGAPAPEWLREAEVCNFLYQNWAERSDLLTAENFPLLLFADRIQWPIEGHPTAFVKRAHERGIRVIPYVCFSELSDLSKARDRGYYNALFDLEYHADDWVCIDPEGEYVVSPYGMRTDQPHLYAMCMNAEGYRERVLEVVRTLMDGGVDGLFIDNVASWAASDCSGEMLDRHRHVEPNTPLPVMYKRLMQAVYDLVKSYGNDNIVMHNGGMDWRSCDARMVEGFIYSSPGQDPHPRPEHVLHAIQEFEEAWRHGKVQVALSYTARAPDHRDADFYSYAAAKLAGCIWTSWFSPLTRTPGAFPALYRLRLGNPMGEVIREGDVLARCYERGAVVLNAGDAEVVIDLSHDAAALEDLYAHEILQPTEDAFAMRVPGHSGRVYVVPEADDRTDGSLHHGTHRSH